MSSEVKLSGDAAGRIILQGNDTITTDQTFTFPDTGGEIVTAPTGGSVVGYQQGVWTPAIPSSSTAHSLWCRNGNAVTVQTFVGNIGVGLTGSTVLEVKGLPYPVSGQALGAAMGENFNVPVTASFAFETNQAVKLYAVAAGASWSNMTAANRVNSSCNAWFSITYFTNDTTWTPINGATVS